jgi:hypothetical protein
VWLYWQDALILWKNHSSVPLSSGQRALMQTHALSAVNVTKYALKTP